MNITVAETASLINIVVDGNVEVLDFKNFQDRMKAIAKSSLKDIVIDLINMNYISSATIGDLYNLKKSQEKKGKKLIFNNISSTIISPLTCCLLLEKRDDPYSGRRVIDLDPAPERSFVP